MPFVPYGKNGRQAPQKAARLEAEGQVLDYAVSASRVPMDRPGLCLQACVFVERFLARRLPGPAFTIRFGSLYAGPLDGSDGIRFDPRPDDIDTSHAWLEHRRGQMLDRDAAFHAWLQDRRGRLLDPSINVTLHSYGYRVKPGLYLLAQSHDFVLDRHRYLYEELPELELRTDAESDAVMDGWVNSALLLQPFALDRVCAMDLGWRKSATNER